MVGFSRALFALSSASLAILSLAYGEFAPGGLSLPAWMPWRDVWVYGSALLVLGASFGLWSARTMLASVLTVAAYEAVWALISVPQILTEPLGIGAWYPFCEALTGLVGALVLYAMFLWKSEYRELPIGAVPPIRAAQLAFGLCCVFYGASHFAYADYTAGMVPAWLPGRLALAYFTGLGHIAAGIGVIVGILPRLAATLEAIMMTLFGLLVWLPSFFAQPRPVWATPPHSQWSEVVVNIVLATSAWIVATALKDRPWGFVTTSRPPVGAAALR